MRSGVLIWGGAIVAFVACGAANSANLNRMVEPGPAVWDWTGGYIGVHGGGGYGGTSFSDPYGPSIYGDVVSTPVFLAGGQLGYNWQRDRLVFGAELDASYAVSDGTNSCFAFSGTAVIDTCHAGPNSFFTATARVGYTFGPQGQMLAYVKAGVAWQNNRGEIANNNEFSRQDFPGFGRHTTHFDYGRFGWSLGAGVEQALSPDWSVKFEYDYMGFSGTRLTTPSTVQYPPLGFVSTSSSNLSSSYHVGKVGLNYHFGVSPRSMGRNDTLLSDGATEAQPIVYTGDWSFEGGSRAWLSRGIFQWDYILAPPTLGDESIPSSRLTYRGLDGISGEFFGRLDSPWGIFLKGNIGAGRFDKGRMNDEDSSINKLAYSNTLHGQANGKFAYYTADAGFNFLRGSTYKLGAFVGWTYYGQKSDSTGCAQIASPFASCQVPMQPLIIGRQESDWNAPRIGLYAETMLLERWRVSADVAYLPWTDFRGRDDHLLRNRPTFYDQRGQGGGGVQVEGALSYFFNKNFSIGIGARYWAMWTKNNSNVTYNCICDDVGKIVKQPALAKYSMERWGTFIEFSYRFD
ncbi:outer membrane beta-barrel protein [Mesorhizobium sp. VK22B]|uniref:Outer membrane beta-barrel protein n=1 Tax=Mesorhizobium captivum TaxID=3072319 RepID=A0ABU4Z4P6_9HYPH|nr:outer membrane beta-barrel protein [Mesorhizobium sp. VK22B]MDX8494209.1 outer membrane beta-barrel protein [Mesorhizobium sp. VK22B]